MSYPVNQPITYTAVASTVGMPSNTFTYAWAFDDGGTGNTASLGHTWTTKGSHSATITATDNVTAGIATATKTINVSDETWHAHNASQRVWLPITYGNGIFAMFANDNATGTGGIMTSPDGTTWTSRNSPVAANFKGAAYGNGTYVSVWTSGGNGAVVYSADSITWTSPTSPNRQWQCVAFGGGVFTALSYLGGTTGQAMTSPDGINWTSRNTSSDQDWRGICYGNGKFVAVCVGSVTMTSPDGITWTTGTCPTGSWSRVAYGNGIYIAINGTVTTGQSMWSTDGLNWNQVTLPDALQMGSVSYGNGWFVITTTSVGLTWGSYLTQDCQTFYKINTDQSNGAWQGSVYGVDRFVATSTNNQPTNQVQTLIW